MHYSTWNIDASQRLTLGDVRVGIARPHLLVRAEHAKLNRPRRVPL
jgi:hypothetical protein